MADFELNLSNGEACTGSVPDVQLHGLALETAGRGDIAHKIVHCGDFVRAVVDVSQLARYMEDRFADDGATGPLIAMWATQLCMSHRGTTSDAYRQDPRLEYLGGWFLPTADATTNDRLPVAIEQPASDSPYRATAQRLDSNGQKSRFDRPVFGITLPRTPEMQAQTELAEAILLAPARGEDVYGLLHRSKADTASNIERIIPPAEAGKRLRASVGAMILNVSKPY